jgi:hypothetical protein
MNIRLMLAGLILALAAKSRTTECVHKGGMIC